MPELTPNLNLKKPIWDTEVADIRVFNENMDIIDEKITEQKEQTLQKGENLISSFDNAEKILAALQGNGGLRFDPNLLYLNDEGTKRVGYYYLDRLKNGIFECLEETTTTVNDSSKFRDISNKASSDRLDNLLTINDIPSSAFIGGSYGMSFAKELKYTNGVLEFIFSGSAKVGDIITFRFPTAFTSEIVANFQAGHVSYYDDSSIILGRYNGSEVSFKCLGTTDTFVHGRIIGFWK